jgi:Cu2+-exporting ATPase
VATETVTMRTRLDCTVAAEASRCYHCALLIPGAVRYGVVIDGAERPMCCRGCKAVAEAIIDAGLVDYYRHRSAPAASQRDSEGVIPAELRAYDVAEFQRSFVREVGEHTKEATLILEGIACAACVWLNEQHIARLPGVLSVNVNYTTRRARVRWDERTIALSDILREIAAIGYIAHPYDSARLEAAHRKERKSALWRLFVAGFGMMQVMMYAVPAYLDGDMPADIESLMRWASLALTLPVLLFSAQPFFSGALRDLKNRRLGMDVPVALGIAAAFFASVWSTSTGAGEVYFDSVTMFVFLLLTARYLENVARQKAASAAEELVKIIPSRGRRMRAYPALRVCEEVPVSSLSTGEVVLVQPGEVIPVDGNILEGATRVDEALLTGESALIVKRSGDAVSGGTLNSESPIIIEVTGVGDDTVLAGIVRLLDRALGEKPRLAELADRASGVFVLMLLAIAAAVAVVWSFVEPGRVLAVTVAVLVVSCPCALSLATPAALAAATGSLARRGVLITRGHALETLARATHFVFDKTGTLTEGKFKLIGVIPVSSASREQCLVLAAALEAGSEHRIAKALVAAAPKGGCGPQTSDLLSVPGGGMEGRVDGLRVRIGTPEFVAELTVQPLPRALSHIADDVTVVALGDDNGWLALFTLGDKLRSDARCVVAELKRLGKIICLLSGDRPEVVRTTAQRLGIEAWKGRAAPQDKLEFVRQLAREGAVVAMVGDGVNDAPVLAQAHVSVAARGATQVAQGAADVILLSDNLAPIAEAARLAKKTLNVIRQNLAWALVYNAVSLPLAALGYVTPWLAGIGMAGSSLIVVANALRLTQGRNNIVRGALASPSPTQAARAGT